MADAARKRELIAQLDRARSRATAHQRELTEDLQVGDKLKESVNTHRGTWLGAAALIGLLISKIPPRTKTIKITAGSNGKVAKEAKQFGMAGLGLAALKWLFDLVRPLIISWGSRYVKSRLSGGPAPYRRM
jgi:hypothetical protein